MGARAGGDGAGRGRGRWLPTSRGQVPAAAGGGGQERRQWEPGTPETPRSGCQFPAVEMPAKSEGAGEEGGGLDSGGGRDAGSWAATPASRPRAAPTQRGGARRAPTSAAALDADRLARAQGWAPEGGDSSPRPPAERRPQPEAARLDAAPGAPDGVRTSRPPRAGEGADPTHVRAGEVGGRAREAGARPTGRRGS